MGWEVIFVSEAAMRARRRRPFPRKASTGGSRAECLGVVDLQRVSKFPLRTVCPIFVNFSAKKRFSSERGDMSIFNHVETKASLGTRCVNFTHLIYKRPFGLTKKGLSSKIR